MKFFKSRPLAEDELSEFETLEDTAFSGKPENNPRAWNDLDSVVTNFRSIELVENPNTQQADYQMIEHPLTIREACEGVSIFGGIGSGKTSGSGAQLARAYLRAGFGGLVLCAKKDEAETWRQYAKQTGRSGSILEFDVSGEWCFPFLEYEASRVGEGAGYTENIVRLLLTVQEAIERGQTGGEEAFWKRELAKLLRNAVDLLILADMDISIPALARLVEQAPLTEEQAYSEEWQANSELWRVIQEGNAKFDERSRWEKADFDTTVTYWLEQFPRMPEKQRGSTLSMFTGLIDNFMRRPFRQLFGEVGGGSRGVLVPDLSFEGIIIILNFPVKEFGDAGRAVQIVYKYLWQQAMERRPVDKPRPVFLWADEAQNFATEYDMQFQATARSSKACTVYLTQNLPNYFAEIGNKHRVDSLIGNLQTKIWHANSDPETNEHAANSIGKSWQYRRSESNTIGQESVNIGQAAQQSLEFDVIPQTFTTLRKGGPMNRRIVEGIIFQNGRVWDNGQTHIRAIFNQT